MSLVLEGNREDDVAAAANALRDGDVVAFPTETVYGLGADARSDDAVLSVFRAKGRPADNPLIVHMASTEAVFEADFLDEISPHALLLGKTFWPGPITLILKLKQHPTSSSDKGGKKISRYVTAGLDTVGIRVPKHPVAGALLAAAGIPIAAPSANTSGKPSPTTATHVLNDLNCRIYAILDGGAVNIGIESTVLDTTSSALTILRPGAITKFVHLPKIPHAYTSKTQTFEKVHRSFHRLFLSYVFLRYHCLLSPEKQFRRQIEEVVGEEVVYSTHNDKTEGPRAPGMKYRHYAPSAIVRIISGDTNDFFTVVEQMQHEARIDPGKSHRTIGVLSWDDTCTELSRCFPSESSAGEDVEVKTVGVGDRGDVSAFARYLYSGLRFLDEVMKVNIILIQGIDDLEGNGLGAAVMNRVRKAAEQLDH